MSGTCQTVDLAAFDATHTAVGDDPTVGQGTFTTVTTWEDGTRARTTARSFSIETDEPKPLGGTDRAVDPMELLERDPHVAWLGGWPFFEAVGYRARWTMAPYESDGDRALQ